MRRSFTLAVALTAVSLAGCANAKLMCGLDDKPEWVQLHKAPIESRLLVATIPHTFSFIDYERNNHYWFKRKDGALLLCRQDPQGVNTGRCDSDGWRFTRYKGACQVSNEWESMCTE